jgi:hypothetical protein
MDISRYDQPAQSNAQNTFVQTYSPIPFNEMMAVGQMKQQQYEQGMNALMKTYEDTYNLRYIPNTKDEQYIKGQVIPTTKEIFDKYSNEDISDPVVRRQLRQELAQKIDKSKVKDIQDSWVGWAQNEQVKQKLAEEGKYADYLDKDSSGYDTSRNGVWNFHTPAKLDYRKQAEDYFNNVEPDSYVNSEGEIVRYVNPSKIKHVASGVVQHFRETNEGQQKLKELEASHGVKLTREQGDEALSQYLNEVGKEKVFHQVAGFDPERHRANHDKPVPAQPVSYSPQFTLAGTKDEDVPSVEDVSGIKKQGFISKLWDAIKERVATTEDRWSNRLGKTEKEIPISTPAMDKLMSGNIVQPNEKTLLYKQIEKQAKDMFQYKGNDEKQLSGLTKKYLEHFYTKAHSIPVFELPTEKAASETNDLMFNKNNMSTNREFYDTEKALTPGNRQQYSELVKDYPQSKYLYNVVGAIGANNPMFSSGRQVNIYSKDDKGQPKELVKTYYMGGDEIEKRKGDFAHQFHEINYNIIGNREYDTKYYDYNLGKAIPMNIKQKRVDSLDGDQYKIDIEFNLNNKKYEFRPIDKNGDDLKFQNTEDALMTFKQYYDSITQSKK